MNHFAILAESFTKWQNDLTPWKLTLPPDQKILEYQQYRKQLVPLFLMYHLVMRYCELGRLEIVWVTILHFLKADEMHLKDCKHIPLQ